MKQDTQSVHSACAGTQAGTPTLAMGRAMTKIGSRLEPRLPS